MICYFSTFEVIAVWFKDPARKKVNLEVNPPSKRKKRSTPTLSIDADDIYDTYELMKKNIGEDGVFSFRYLQFAQLF